MKKLFVFIAVLLMCSVSALAVNTCTTKDGDTNGFMCYISNGEKGVEMCLSDDSTNRAFCEGLNDKQVPQQPGLTFVSSTQKDETVTYMQVACVPEFTTIGAGIALIGSIGAYFSLRRIKSKRNAQ